MPSRALPSLLLAAALLAAPGAHAQSAANQSMAEASYEAGRKLFLAGNYAEACPKFEESQRLDPGVGTLLFLGSCYEKTGRTASAWVTFREAAVAARAGNQPDREKKATDLANAIEPKLARILVLVPPESDLPGLVIKRDGSLLGRALWGTPFAVDQGLHSLEISAPGRKTQVLSVEVSLPAQVVTARIPALEALPAPAASSAPAVTASAPPPPLPPPTSPPDSSLRTPALVAAGVGVLGVAMGSFFGLQAFRQWHESQDSCVGNRCPAEGYDKAQAASRSGHFSTAFFAVGALGLGAGLTLWLVSPAPTASGQTAPHFLLGTSGSSVFARAAW